MMYEDVMLVYHKNLLENKTAKGYLFSRGIKLDTIKKYKLGFSCGNLKKMLIHFSEEDLINNYVLKHGGTEKFLNSIVIPIFEKGVVSSFTSRYIMDDNLFTHMHLNGTFKIPYNVDALSKKYVIITESPIDCLILNQVGFNAVSFFGTNGYKTPFLEYFKNVNNIFILFDSDANKSGINGALNTANKFYTEGDIDIYISTLDSFFDSGTKKLDINTLYLQDMITFKSKIQGVLKNGILYSKTKHYKEYLVKQENIKKAKNKRDLYKNEIESVIEYVRSMKATELIKRDVAIDSFSFGGACLCPLHEDKQNSLVIYDNSGVIVCFGCGFKGDYIEFTKKLYNLSFVDAVKKIKSDYNI